MRRLAALATLLALCACSKPTIVGKWNSTDSNLNVPITVEFKPDGTVAGTATGGIPGMNAKVEFDGTWKIDGETLTQDITSSTFNGQAFGLPKAYLHRVGKVKIDKDKFTVTWPDGLQEFTAAEKSK